MTTKKNTVATRQGKELQVPTVHLNGTGKRGLTEPLLDAYRAVREACAALNQTAPHARDYYVQEDPQAYEKAREQYEARGRKLVEVMDELMVLAVEIQDQE